MNPGLTFVFNDTFFGWQIWWFFSGHQSFFKFRGSDRLTCWGCFYTFEKHTAIMASWKKSELNAGFFYGKSSANENIVQQVMFDYQRDKLSEFDSY